MRHVVNNLVLNGDIITAAARLLPLEQPENSMCLKDTLICGEPGIVKSKDHYATCQVKVLRLVLIPQARFGLCEGG